MANITENIIYNNFDRFTGEVFNTEVVTKYQDGSDMTDGKVDNVIYFKNKPELGGGYSRRCFTGHINVLWFGAKGDRVNDDSEAIQAAFLAAAAYKSETSPAGDYRKAFGSSVYIPAGFYLCKSSIEWKHDVSLFGDGAKSSVVYFDIDPESDGFYNVVEDPSTGRYPNICGGGFSVYGAPSPNIGTIREFNVRDLMHFSVVQTNFDSCEFKYANRHSFYFDTSINSEFKKCYFSNANSHNFMLASSEGSIATTITWDSCYFINSDLGSGCYIEACLGATFSNQCIFEFNGTNDYDQPVDPSIYGWGLLVKQGKVSTFAPYLEGNKGGGLWLGSERVLPPVAGLGNTFVVISLVNQNTNGTPTIRIDEAELFILEGDYVSQAAIGGIYQFFAKGASSWSINTGISPTRIKFYDQDTDAEIDPVTLSYLNLKTRFEGSNIKQYFGSETYLQGRGFDARTNGQGAEPINEIRRDAIALPNSFMYERIYSNDSDGNPQIFAEMRYYQNSSGTGTYRGDVALFTARDGVLSATPVWQAAGNRLYVPALGFYSLPPVGTGDIKQLGVNSDNEIVQAPSDPSISRTITKTISIDATTVQDDRLKTFTTIQMIVQSGSIIQSPIPFNGTTGTITLDVTSGDILTITYT